MLIRLGGLLAIIGIVLWLWALFDALTTPPERIRNMPKAIWVLVILLFTDLGAVLWFVAGRPRGAAAPAPARRAPRAPLAPDDDPDFLRKLGEETRRRRRDEQGDT